MKNIDLIFQHIANNSGIQYKNLKEYFSNINETTLTRNLKKLIEQNKIEKIEKNNFTFYSPSKIQLSLQYLKKDIFDREGKKYNFDFLKKYIPNKTSFLLNGYEKIKSQYDFSNSLSTYDYMINIRGIENMLIDTSFASSKLEGNTYSYLDTEVLIKYNEKADGKTTLETQMILNHKNIIKYLFENKKTVSYNKITFFEIHTLLGKNILSDIYLGNIREKEVRIGGSSYIPIDNKYQLEEQFELFLEKLNLIKNPFEQSLFILVFIPYFQIFMDINKRTSRISANLPLIKNGLAPISLLQVKERDYINAILAIYELNDVSLMRDLFVNNYLLNFKRYI